MSIKKFGRLWRGKCSLAREKLGLRVPAGEAGAEGKVSSFECFPRGFPLKGRTKTSPRCPT